MSPGAEKVKLACVVAVLVGGPGAGRAFGSRFPLELRRLPIDGLLFPSMSKESKEVTINKLL